jgi:hypothetical protein
MSLLSAGSLLLVGCQSAYHAETPIGLDERLARVEATRRVPTHDSDQPASFAMTPATGVARVRANQPPPLTAQLAVVQQAAYEDRALALTARWGDLATLTMSDLVDPQESERPSESQPSSLKSQASSLSEEKHLRRPPLKSFRQTAMRDLKDMPSDLWHDTKGVYGNPVNVGILTAAYGGAIAIQQSGPDRTVEHHFNTNHDCKAPDHMFSKDWREAFAAMGNPGTHFALAGAWYLLGQQTMDDKTYEVGKTLFSALTINGLTVVVGQTASYGRSPNGELGTLPSGHTSSSFCFASVMHEAYGHAVGIPLYGLATLAGIERLDDREHYLSDVVMGAVLGTVVGHSVASGRDPEFFGWKILPYASPENGSGVAFMKTLD